MSVQAVAYDIYDNVAADYSEPLYLNFSNVLYLTSMEKGVATFEISTTKSGSFRLGLSQKNVSSSVSVLSHGLAEFLPLEASQVKAFDASGVAGEEILLGVEFQDSFGNFQSNLSANCVLQVRSNLTSSDVSGLISNGSGTIPIRVNISGVFSIQPVCNSLSAVNSTLTIRHALPNRISVDSSSKVVSVDGFFMVLVKILDVYGNIAKSSSGFVLVATNETTPTVLNVSIRDGQGQRVFRHYTPGYYQLAVESHSMGADIQQLTPTTVSFVPGKVTNVSLGCQNGSHTVDNLLTVPVYALDQYANIVWEEGYVVVAAVFDSVKVLNNCSLSNGRGEASFNVTRPQLVDLNVSSMSFVGAGVNQVAYLVESGINTWQICFFID